MQRVAQPIFFASSIFAATPVRAAEVEPPPELADDGLSAPTTIATSKKTSATKKEKRQQDKAARNAERNELQSPMHRRYGFGAARTLSAANTMWFEFFPAATLSLGIHAGLATFSHKETNDNGEFKQIKNVGTFALAPSAFVWPLKLQASRNQSVYADVGIGLRTTFYIGFLGKDKDDDKTLDRPLELDVEVPIALRVFFGKNVCVTPEFGFVTRWVPGSREPDRNGDFDENPGTGVGERLGTTNGPGLGFELGNHSGLFIGLGVGYFFSR